MQLSTSHFHIFLLIEKVPPLIGWISRIIFQSNKMTKFRRLEMGTMIIDIDKLLEATSNLTSEKNNNKVKKVEIDILLENTRDW
jgi:hypothetical protein